MVPCVAIFICYFCAHIILQLSIRHADIAINSVHMVVCDHDLQLARENGSDPLCQFWNFTKDGR